MRRCGEHNENIANPNSSQAANAPKGFTFRFTSPNSQRSPMLQPKPSSSRDEKWGCSPASFVRAVWR